jgi:hypothetical protein
MFFGGAVRVLRPPVVHRDLRAVIEEIDPAAARPGRPGGSALRAWSGARLGAAALREGVVATFPAWLAAHIIVFWVSWDLYPDSPLHGLYVWDTVWYWRIAQYGYDYDATGGLIHFFPLTSVFAAVFAALARLPVSIALFAFCWTTALLFGALVHRLTVRETGDRQAAARAAWLSQLAPGAFVLVMGYTEPLAGVLAVAYFLAARAPMAGRPRAAWAAIALGFLSGMARPTGVLLAIPGAVEGVRAARQAGWRRGVVARAVLTTLAPGAGLASFLAYSRLRYGSWMLPFTEQVSAANRAAVMNNPLFTLSRLWQYDWRGHGHAAATMSALLIVGFAALLLAVWWHLPVSYLAWALPSFVLGIGSQEFTSLPRYVGALFPALIAAALIARRPWQWAALLAGSCALFVWSAYFALAGFAVA